MGMAKAYHITGEKAIPRPSYFRPLLLAIIRGDHICCSFLLFLVFNSCPYLWGLKIERREERSNARRNDKREMTWSFHHLFMQETALK
jgi:hypothetical protein